MCVCGGGGGSGDGGRVLVSDCTDSRSLLTFHLCMYLCVLQGIEKNGILSLALDVHQSEYSYETC